MDTLFLEPPPPPTPKIYKSDKKQCGVKYIELTALFRVTTSPKNILSFSQALASSCFPVELLFTQACPNLVNNSLMCEKDEV